MTFACLTSLADRIDRLTGTIGPRDKKSSDPRVTALRAFFARPDGMHSFADWLRLLLEELFVIDAPPCLSSSDPAALAAVAGQVLLVVEAEKTRRGEIEAALDLIDACPNIKLLLNKIRLTTRDTFGIRS